MTERDSSTIQRSYKFRFYPHRLQRQRLAMEFGHAWWVWNSCLTWRGRQYRVHDKRVSGVDFSRQLTFLKGLGPHAWLSEATRDCLMQKLNVKGMMANRRVAKSLGDVGMHELKRQLEYKAKWHGREFVQVDRWAPTSKTCSVCGTVQESMPLKVRQWTCPDCQTVHDRDSNAAKNILSLATGGRPGSDARGGVHPPEAACGC